MDERDGLTLSAWLRAAARDRLAERQRSKPCESPVYLEEFRTDIMVVEQVTGGPLSEIMGVDR